MLKIRFRRRGASWRKKHGLPGPRTTTDTTNDLKVEENKANDDERDVPLTRTKVHHMHLSMEFFVDGPCDEEAPPDLLEESFTSSSSDEDDMISADTMIPEKTEGRRSRRVRFLLPTETDQCKRSVFAAKATAFSAESLVKGDFPMAQSHNNQNDELDVHRGTVPGGRIWLVGTIPKLPQEDDVSSDEESNEDYLEDGPFDAGPAFGASSLCKAAQGDDEFPFEERCDCCKDRSRSVSSRALYRSLMVFEACPRRWIWNVREAKRAVKFPTFAALQTALKRTIVVDSDRPQDLCVYVNKKNVKEWNVEALLLVFVQLLLLKVSASSS